MSIDLGSHQDRRVDDPPRRRGDLGRTLVRGTGQTLITFGGDLPALRRVRGLGHRPVRRAGPGATRPADPRAVGGRTDRRTGAGQYRPVHAGRDRRRGGRAVRRAAPPPLAGGDGYSRVVVEGTSQVELAQGPGHYSGTAMPGERGNAAFAGHRVGRGSPFLDLDRLRPGDPVVVETGNAWSVHRVLGDPATGDLGTDPSGIPGQEIVAPTDVAVISPTPGWTAHR